MILNQPCHNLRMLLIDNQVLFREGLISMLKNEPDIQIVGEVGTAKEGIEKAIELAPDIILMEMDLPDEDGCRLTKKILCHLPQTKVVILTIYDSTDMLIAALLAGAKGYLVKYTPLTAVLASLQAVARGEIAIPRARFTLILEELIRLEHSNSFHNLGNLTEKNLSANLTHREIEVLQLLATNKSNQDIANQLFISENTVKVHVNRILGKLKYKTRSEAGEFARRYGFGCHEIESPEENSAVKVH
jgi:DNA-binding NarL/FixJ family response regulator